MESDHTRDDIREGSNNNASGTNTGVHDAHDTADPSTSKRKQPADEEHPHESTEERPPTIETNKRQRTDETLWYEDGTVEYDAENGRNFKWIKAEKCPGQQRIRGQMSDEEKLNVALENNRKREIEQIRLEIKKIYIKYMGKNTPMGIPGNGDYDYNNPEHKLAIIKVGGGTRKTKMQIQLEKEIQQKKEDEKKQAQEIQQPKPQETTAKLPIKAEITYKNLTLYVYLYETEEQRAHIPKDALHQKVTAQPTSDHKSSHNNETSLWDQLQTSFTTLTNEEKTQFYWKILDKFNLWQTAAAAKNVHEGL